MYFTYVGDPQLSHRKPPHAGAGLHRCINFLKRPVDSEGATGLGTRSRGSSGATRRSAEFVRLEGRQAV